KEQLKSAISDELSAHYGIKPSEASADQAFSACAILMRQMISRRRAENEKNESRQLHYLSMEFLMGRSLAKNAYNLGILPQLYEALGNMGFEISDIFEAEPDAGLGNGGLGRLAACYMDSLATLDKPATGYSLCYELGMFRQELRGGKQIERPDNWELASDCWLVPDYDDAVEVQFGGRVEENWDISGKCSTNITGSFPVLAVPRDMLVCGYGNTRVNLLRLWEARSPQSLDMKLFSGGEYVKSMEQRTMAEVITKVLYPADEHIEGKTLRIRQQYFFVSATAQTVVKKHRAKFATVKDFADHHVFQINDTHPTLIIPELMRIFMDEDGLGWDEALHIVENCVAYTNHTVMSEALERWPREIIEAQLPRIWQIIKEIDGRYRKYLSEKFSGNEEAILRNLIIAGGKVHMANLCQAVCFKINGVSALHSEILKSGLFRDIYFLAPGKFTNVTNGVDHRRWLSQINPRLDCLIKKLLGGDDYLTQPEKLSELEKFIGDEAVLSELEAIKRENKTRFADYIRRTQGIELDTGAIFDVQVKRLHEYKRQLLCAMLITHLQLRIHSDPDAHFTPRTFIFGAKAASGYKLAKRIIELICSLADDINSDPLCRGKLQVIFVENYRVSVAEKLMPAAQVSEQISTAGKEASGTGNMKLMMNGAVTIGTLDGANVEMYERLGDGNMFLFGLHSEEVSELKAKGYVPAEIYENNDAIRKVFRRFASGFRDGVSYSDLVSKLVYGGDDYMLLADFDSYVAAHNHMYEVISYEKRRSGLSLINIARSGCFAADRAVSEYCQNIWRI
ncbi:MAG: glycogen/starch/alpha-glucan family phosphorylase, partial [Clostridia bacterium]|nr:glycogen/starch/alpha-glucan family phosphorylase [Clostridia bacterium]